LSFPTAIPFLFFFLPSVLRTPILTVLGCFSAVCYSATIFLDAQLIKTPSKAYQRRPELQRTVSPAYPPKRPSPGPWALPSCQACWALDCRGTSPSKLPSIPPPPPPPAQGDHLQMIRKPRSWTALRRDCSNLNAQCCPVPPQELSARLQSESREGGMAVGWRG
jgi:hypothetical protein